MGPWWTFRCYIDAKGVDVIDEWHQAQPDGLQAKFDTRAKYLRQQPRALWIRPYFETLHGEGAGLGEIRFEWKNVQYRPLGVASGEREFTLLSIAHERGGK